MKFTVNHGIMLGCSALAAVAEVLVNFSASGNPLPFHLTAGACLAAVTVLGAVSKSVMNDSGKPVPTVAADVLKAIAASLETGPATVMHVAIVSAVREQLLAVPPAPKA